MILVIVAITGWILAAVFSWPWWQIWIDWLASEWERRHRPTWPPTEQT